MIDLLFQIALSNVCISLALAILAIVVQKTIRRPSVAYLLWLLVFVKLVSPPIVTVPVIAIEGNIPSQQAEAFGSSEELHAGAQANALSWSGLGSRALDRGKPWLLLFWVVGSVFVLSWSLYQLCRFGRLLGMESQKAPRELQSLGVKIAKRFGLKKTPAINTTSAQISPMVWWMGGKVRIVIPESLLDRMDVRQLQWILAHELAHVRRRDYLVRWIEWLACVFFWWNPVVWWARHNLRINEELCCDALVVSSLKPSPHTYADSLLKAVESLACPVYRPPAMASEINSGGLLERRFKMIVTGNKNGSKSRWLQACVLPIALLALPLGLAIGRDLEAGIEERLEREHEWHGIKQRIERAVERGDMTREKADAKYDEIKERMASRHKHHCHKGDCMDDFMARIEKAVEEGELTEQEAQEKIEWYKKRMKIAGERERVEAHLERVWERLQNAVEEGDLTEEEARREMAEIKEKAWERVKECHHHDEKAEIDDRIEKIWKRLQNAVERGDMTEEEACSKMHEIKKKAWKKVRDCHHHDEEAENDAHHD